MLSQCRHKKEVRPGGRNLKRLVALNCRRGVRCVPVRNAPAKVECFSQPPVAAPLPARLLRLPWPLPCAWLQRDKLTALIYIASMVMPSPVLFGKCTADSRSAWRG